MLGPTQLQDILAGQPSGIAGPAMQPNPATATNPANIADASAPLLAVSADSTSITVTEVAVAINGPRRRRMNREVSPFHDTEDLGRGRRKRKPVPRHQ